MPHPKSSRAVVFLTWVTERTGLNIREGKATSSTIFPSIIAALSSNSGVRQWHGNRYRLREDIDLSKRLREFVALRRYRSCRCAYQGCCIEVFIHICDRVSLIAKRGPGIQYAGPPSTTPASYIDVGSAGKERNDRTEVRRRSAQDYLSSGFPKRQGRRTNKDGIYLRPVLLKCDGKPALRTAGEIGQGW